MKPPQHVISSRSSWLSLLAVALGVMVVQLDGTVVAIATPSIAENLHASTTSIQWVTTAYLLVFAGLLIPAGALTDKFGRKRAFLIGVGAFSLASVLCGLAPNVEVLIACRALQAVFAALLATSGLAVIRTAFEPAKLPLALGWFGSVSAIALAGGPVVGGVMVRYASWPWVFYVNLPVGLIAVLIGARVIGESERNVLGRVDLPSAALFITAMTSFVWGVTTAQQRSWLSVTTVSAIAVGVVFFGLFLNRQRHHRDSMVPLALFADRSFAIAAFAMVVTMFAYYGILFYLTFYLQGVQGRDGIGAAVALLPLTAVLAVAAPGAGWVVKRLGCRPALLVGSLCTTVALTILTTLRTNSGVALLAPTLVLAGCGAGLLLVAGAQILVGSAPEEKAGAASGIQQTTQQLGATLGVAVLGSVFSTTIAHSLRASAASAPDGLSGERLQNAVALGFPPELRNEAREMLLRRGISSAHADHVVNAFAELAHRLFLDGLHTVYVVAAGVVVVMGLLCLLVRKPKDAP